MPVTTLAGPLACLGSSDCVMSAQILKERAWDGFTEWRDLSSEILLALPVKEEHPLRNPTILGRPIPNLLPPTPKSLGALSLFQFLA